MANPDIDVWDFSLGKCVPQKTLRKGAILTLAAAGSEMSNSCVITNTETNEKRGYGCSCNRMDFAIENPELTYTVSPYQTACGIVDIAMHTIERYFCPGEDTYLTDAIAEAVIKNVMKAGKDCLADPENYEARANMMWASSLAHNGLTGCGRKTQLVVHQLEHEVSGMYTQVAHGAGLAALWCSWARYVCKVHPENEKLFARFARSVWDIAEPDIHKAANAGIDASEAYFKSLGMPVSIGALSCGVQDAAGVEDLAARVSYHGTRRVGTLVSLDHEALREIFEMANH